MRKVFSEYIHIYFLKNKLNKSNKFSLIYDNFIEKSQIKITTTTSTTTTTKKEKDRIIIYK